MADKPTELDLMLYADGELDGSERARVESEIAGSEEAAALVEGVHQVGDAVKTCLEIETDRAEESLPGWERLWSNVERAIHANGASREPAAVLASGSSDTEDGDPGLWHTVRGWFSGSWQGHVLTAAAAAAAVAVVMWATRSPQQVIEQRTVVDRGAVSPVPAAADLESQPPEVENLEVHSGEGMILTIPGETDDDSSTAVIWISNETDVEGPI